MNNGSPAARPQRVGPVDRGVVPAIVTDVDDP